MCFESDNECVLEVTMNVFESDNECVQCFNYYLNIYNILHRHQIKKVCANIRYYSMHECHLIHVQCLISLEDCYDKDLLT